MNKILLLHINYKLFYKYKKARYQYFQLIFSYGPSEILTGRSGNPSSESFRTETFKNESFESDKIDSNFKNPDEKYFLDSEITSCPSVGQFDTDIESVPSRLLSY